MEKGEILNMTNIDDGGPAFPIAVSTGDPRDGVYSRDGMSLRDYFAGQALIDIRIRTHIAKASGHIVSDCSPKDMATEAYIIADEMMKARNKIN
jgi:hypothetical protein